MSSIFNYGFLFQNSSTTGSNGIFSSGNSIISDYALIKSGSYKKLVSAYYDKANTSDKTDTDSKKDTKVDSTETGKLLNVKTDAQSLQEASQALDSAKLYQSTGKDEEGNAQYDREGIKKAVKSYVSAYNSYLDSSSATDSTTVMQKSLSMIKTTSSHSRLLKEVGITVGKDNKLVVDEEKLDKADVSTLSSLFKGDSSYGDKISQKAAESYKVANSAIYTGTHGASYTYSGSYSLLGATNNSWDQYF